MLGVFVLIAIILTIHSLALESVVYGECWLFIDMMIVVMLSVAMLIVVAS
jgi:hypothetical protein